MRVLLMNQFFWPDNAATGQLLTDLAQDLVRDGHTVEVICGGSYADTGSTAGIETVPAIVVHRIRGMRFSRSISGRVLSYLTFYLGAFWRALRLPEYDAVLTLTTPPLLSVGGAILKFLRGTRFYIWEMDVYPDVAINLGYMTAGGVLDRTVGVLADWSRRRADKIFVLGECMRERLIARGIPSTHMVVVDNWADASQIEVRPNTSERNSLQVVYSGNLGLAHDVDTIISAMRELKDDSRFRFLFIGGGARRGEIAHFIETEAITLAELLPYVARTDLGESLSAGDLGLVTQRDDCCGSVVPSKVYGLLAAGKPLLFIGPEAATPARIIKLHKCGWHIPVGDHEALVSLLQYLVQTPEAIATAGTNARHALEEHFDRPLGTGRIINHLCNSAATTNETGRPGTGPMKLRNVSRDHSPSEHA